MKLFSPATENHDFDHHGRTIPANPPSLQGTQARRAPTGIVRLAILRA